MASVTPLARVELPNGRWMRLHLASVNQQIELDLAPQPKSNAEYRERFQKLLGWLEGACEEKSWDGSVGDGLALSELEQVVSQWLTATEDVAFPLANESDSETNSAEPLSEAPTAVPSRSRTRRSSKS